MTQLQLNCIFGNLHSSVSNLKNLAWKVGSGGFGFPTKNWFIIFQILTVNGGVVKRADIESDNGLVHIVDRVLFPPAAGDLVTF